MSTPPNSGKYAYCAASHADGRSIPAHWQRRQPETRRLPAIGWSACGGKPETVRSKGFSNGGLSKPLGTQFHALVYDGAGGGTGSLRCARLTEFLWDSRQTFSNVRCPATGLFTGFWVAFCGTANDLTEDKISF